MEEPFSMMAWSNASVADGEPRSGTLRAALPERAKQALEAALQRISVAIVTAWVARQQLRPGDYPSCSAKLSARCSLRSRSRLARLCLFAGRRADVPLSLRQYARIVKRWIASAGLDPSRYGAHSLRRTKATLIY